MEISRNVQSNPTVYMLDFFSSASWNIQSGRGVAAELSKSEAAHSKNKSDVDPELGYGDHLLPFYFLLCVGSSFSTCLCYKRIAVGRGLSPVSIGCASGTSLSGLMNGNTLVMQAVFGWLFCINLRQNF